MPTKEQMIYDMLKETRSDVKNLLQKHGECAKQKDLNILKKQFTTAKGYFLGVCGLATVIVTVMKIAS